MKESTFEFWRKWLLWANVLTVVVGLLVAFAGNSVFFDLHNAGTRNAFFGGQALSPEVLRLKNWLFGIIGGTIVGFHILMIYIVQYPFRARARWSYQAMWMGLLSWFVIDSGVSTFYGAFYNVILINLVALVLIGLPLVMLWRGFHRSES